MGGIGMFDRQIKGAWRLYRLNWVPLLLMAQLLILGLGLTDFSLKIDSAFMLAVGMPALFSAAGYALWRAGYPRPAFILVSIAQIELLVLLVTPLTYIAASANLAMQDANLASVDRLLGLDWRAYYNFVCERPGLVPYVYLAYAMITWPPFGIPILLGLTRNYCRLQQFTLACALTVVVTALISSLLPALGTYQEYGISPETSVFRASGYLVQLHELPYVRGGSLRVLDVGTLGGIITFPSFHAAAAVLAMWALWSVWWMRPLALIAYVGMLLATPLVGGHYFVDVFAGVGLAVVAIAAAKFIAERPAAAIPVMTPNIAAA
jgi:hypothetical protein